MLSIPAPAKLVAGQAVAVQLQRRHRLGRPFRLVAGPIETSAPVAAVFLVVASGGGLLAVPQGREVAKGRKLARPFVVLVGLRPFLPRRLPSTSFSLLRRLRPAGPPVPRAYRRVREAASLRRRPLARPLPLPRPAIQQAAWLEPRARPLPVPTRPPIGRRPASAVLHALAMRTLPETGKSVAGARQIPTPALTACPVRPPLEASGLRRRLLT